MSDLALIKELREKTGAGFLDCKNALSENENNIEGNIFDVKITNFNHNTLFGKIIKNKNYVAA